MNIFINSSGALGKAEKGIGKKRKKSKGIKTSEEPRQNRFLQEEEEAGFTVEAVFVTSLTVFALIALIMMTFYLRDTAVCTARIRQLCMEQTVSETKKNAGPAFTLTSGSLSVTGKGARYGLGATGIWPLGLLKSSGHAEREVPNTAFMLRSGYAGARFGAAGE